MPTITRDWSTDPIGQLPAGFTSDTGSAAFIRVQASQLTPESPNSLVVAPDGATHSLASDFGDGGGGNFNGSQFFRISGSPIIQFYYRLAGDVKASPTAYMFELYRQTQGGVSLIRFSNGAGERLARITSPGGGGTFLPENEALKITTQLIGAHLTFQVQRANGFFLTPTGEWVEATTNCFDVTDSDPAAVLAEGKLGYLWFVPFGASFQIGQFNYSATTQPATVTNVTVSPATAIVAGGMTQQFAATVNGANKPDQAVTWTTSLGSITADGLLTAPASLTVEQTVTVTARSIFDSKTTGSASVTVPTTARPVMGVLTLATADGVDLIDYPAPTPGTQPILGVSLLAGTTSGGQSPTPVATNLGGGAGRFIHPCGGYHYTVVAMDVGTPAKVSAPSNEVQGAYAPRGLPATFAQTMAVVRNVLSTFFTPELLVGLAKLKADALDVDIKQIAGSELAAVNFREQAISQSISQSALDAFGAVTSTQLQTKFDATLPPDLLAGLAKLKATTLDVNVVQFAGSADAATKLRDEELSQTISTAAATAIGKATAAQITIPSVGDTATAVWNNSNRTLTASSTV